jgi:hypothetical protein
VTGNREPRDVEARLSAALNAYADVVDAEQTPRRDLARPRRSSPLRGWRASVLAAAAALAVVGGTWVVLDGGSDPSSTAASGGEEASVLDSDAGSGAAPEPSTDSSGAAAADAAGAASAPLGAFEVLPSAEVGVAYPFDLYTHCGVLGADVGNVWFAAQPPLVEEYGPPAGWGNPYQRGVLTLESTSEAVFRDEIGHELRLQAASDSERPPPCA